MADGTPMATVARMTRIARASVAAGPIFLTCAFAADLYLRLPAAVPVETGVLFEFPLFCILAAMVGCVIALPSNVVGTFLMEKLARAFPPARAPEAWALAGGGAAVTPLVLLGAGPNWIFAFAATGALCALICHGPKEPESLPTGAPRG